MEIAQKAKLELEMKARAVEEAKKKQEEELFRQKVE